MNYTYKYAIFSILFFSLVYYIISRGTKVNCELYEQYKLSSFEGVVVKKFIDKREHSFPFVYVKNNKSDHIEKLDLFYDTNAYGVINLKDTLFKRKNDPWIYKKCKRNLIKMTVLTYGCNNL